MRLDEIAASFAADVDFYCVYIQEAHPDDGWQVGRNLDEGVVFEAPTDYVARCFAEYGLKTDDSGRYAAMYKPYHLIGLELGISVASIGLRGEPTGTTTGWRGDVIATAKRDLAPGEVSGLIEAASVLADVEGIEIIRFTGADVVRHELVQRIVAAYDKRGLARGSR